MKYILTILTILILLPFLFRQGGFLMGALRNEVRAANDQSSATIGGMVALANDLGALNDQGRLYLPYSPDARSGIVLAANDANFDAQHLSEPLSEYIVDTNDSDGLEELIGRLFPSVLVGRAFTYRTHDTVESFQAALNDEDIREIGGEHGKVRMTGAQVDGRTDNKGLTMILDNDQGGEDPAIQQAAVLNLKGRLLRADLYRGEALLEANDTAITPNWGASNAAADPDGDLMSELDLGGDSRGINSNMVLYGGSAWVRRFQSLGLGDNSARHQTRNLTPEQIAALVQADSVLISKYRYQSGAATKSKLVGNKVYTYFAKPGLSKEDPSNIKRFVTPVPGGGVWRVYVTPLLKRTAVTLEHYSRLALTSSLGIRKIAPTFT